MLDPRDLPVDAGELERHIEQLGAIGTGPSGGLFRGVYTDEWSAAVARMRAWMEDAGLSTRQDAVGNLYGRLEGSEGGPVVMTGSHIDTVPNGGRYDGALGVHASLAAVAALNRRFGRPRRTIDVLAICDEEGSRFKTDFWGARAVTGEIGDGEADHHRDEAGITLAEAMRSAGFEPSRIVEARRDDVTAWLELHIEQGGTLEADGLDIGVVHTITGHRQALVRVQGRQDHAGTTPMYVRLDPMAGAAEMIQRAVAVAAEMGRPAVCTVGRVDTVPGAFNVVPGMVSFSLDMRDADPARFATLCSRVDAAVGEVAARRGLSFEIEQYVRREPVALDPVLQSLIEETAVAAGVKHRRMPSMAGHDSEVMVRRWPSAMVFVPSHDGRSHTPEEFTTIEQAATGIQILAAVLHRLAYEA